MGPDRAQLEAWIAETRTTQRRLKVFLLVACTGAIAVFAFSRALGGLVFVSIAIVALFGFWITNGHITDWENKIHAVDRPPEKTASGRLRRERD